MVRQQPDQFFCGVRYKNFSNSLMTLLLHFQEKRGSGVDENEVESQFSLSKTGRIINRVVGSTN